MKIFRTGTRMLAVLILLSGTLLSGLTTIGLYIYGERLPEESYKGRYIDVLTLAAISLMVSLMALLFKSKKLALIISFLSLALLLLRNPWAWEGNMWDNPWLFPPLTIGLAVMILLALFVCSAALVGLREKPKLAAKTYGSKTLKVVDFLMLFA